MVQYGTRASHWPGGLFRGVQIPAGDYGREVAFMSRLHRPASPKGGPYMTAGHDAAARRDHSCWLAPASSVTRSGSTSRTRGLHPGCTRARCPVTGGTASGREGRPSRGLQAVPATAAPGPRPCEQAGHDRRQAAERPAVRCSARGRRAPPPALGESEGSSRTAAGLHRQATSMVFTYPRRPPPCCGGLSSGRQAGTAAVTRKLPDGASSMDPLRRRDSSHLPPAGRESSRTAAASATAAAAHRFRGQP